MSKIMLIAHFVGKVQVVLHATDRFDGALFPTKTFFICFRGRVLECHNNNHNHNPVGWHNIDSLSRCCYYDINLILAQSCITNTPTPPLNHESVRENLKNPTKRLRQENKAGKAKFRATRFKDSSSATE